jgi:excisionase family DNA binding protein
VATSKGLDSGTLGSAVARALLAELVAALKADPVLCRDVVALLELPRARSSSDDHAMTVGEVAAALKVSERSVYRALRDGRLRGQRLGSSWRISAAAVEDWKLGRRGGAASPTPPRRQGSYDVARRTLAA